MRPAIAGVWLVDPDLRIAGPARRPFGFEKVVRVLEENRGQMKEAMTMQAVSHLSFVQATIDFRSLIAFS